LKRATAGFDGAHGSPAVPDAGARRRRHSVRNDQPAGLPCLARFGGTVLPVAAL